MDGHCFDDLLRDLSNSRRSLLGTALAAAGALTGLSVTDARKKKKPCARKCKDGCCTKKYGKCVKTAQQNLTQCGTGGEICRSNCQGPVCDAECPGCCNGSTCVEDTSDAQCGAEGEACFPCAADQTCIGHGCCGNRGRSCSPEEFCCTGLACEDNTCCVNNDEPCTQSSDCCNLGSEQICDNGKCLVPTGSTCELGWMCEGEVPCPDSLICAACLEGSSPCGEGCCPNENCCVGGTCCVCCHQDDPTFASCCSTSFCCT